MAEPSPDDWDVRDATEPGSGQPVADRIDVARAVRTERLELAAYLDDLDPQAWETPSLCRGWTVRDVVAHLTLSTRESWRGFLVGMVRHRGDFDGLVAAQAREHARRVPPDELVEQLRASAGSARRAPGSGPLDPLLDLLVHGQDVARPLARPRPVPAGPAIAALDHALASRWYGARQRLAGLRLVATDARWSSGTGADVRGPLAALLLVATGRPAAVDDVAGDGRAILATRLAPDDHASGRS